jgi:hypothetical protein
VVGLSDFQWPAVAGDITQCDQSGDGTGWLKVTVKAAVGAIVVAGEAVTDK